MDERQMREIVSRVAAVCWQQLGAEIPLAFPVEVSARHVHLTREAVERLFGPGATLTPKRELSQPGQFLYEERVSLVTEKGTMQRVAVLGPGRGAVQVELSATDCKALGIDAPLRLSGDLRDAGDVYLVGPKGMVEARGGVIVAQAHIHLPPAEAVRAGVENGQRVSVTLPGARPITLENVICRVGEGAGLAMHIDVDEANACMLPRNVSARMRPKAETAASSPPPDAAPPVPAGEALFEGKLITEATARQLASKGIGALAVGPGVILTPSARDVLLHAGIAVRQTGGSR